MARYIELNAAVTEIEKIIADETESIKSFEHRKNVSEVQRSNARMGVLKHILSLLNTLEAKEVNLKEEIDKIWKPRFSLGWDDKSLLSISYKGFEVFAKHFFELGLKAEDWEKKRMEECPYRQVGCTMYEGKILECRGACSWVVDYPKLKELKHRKENSMTDKVQKKPVSEDLEQAAIDYCSGNKGADARVRAGFIEGAKWKEEQFKKNLLDVCKKQTEEEAEIERDFIEGIIDKHRLPTFDDAIKYGMRLQKEQMMAKAIDAVVSQVPCSNEIILYNPSSVYEYSLPQEMDKLGLNKGDKVKVVIIKSE